MACAALVVLLLTPVSASGGVNGVAATGSFTLGVDVISLTAASNTAAFNDVSVELSTGAAEAVAYAATDRTITVTIRANGTTTTAGVATLINELDDFSATGGSTSPVFVPVYPDVTANGSDSVQSSGKFTIAGSQIVVTAFAFGSAFDRVSVSVDAGVHEAATYDADEKSLRVTIKANGQTGTARVAELINSLDGFSAVGGDTGRVFEPAYMLVTSNGLDPALTPLFDTPVRTADGFTVNVTNFDAAYDFNAEIDIATATLAAGTPVLAIVPGTVTGLTPGQQATLTVTTTRFGFAMGTATLTVSALGGVVAVAVAPSVTCSPHPVQVSALVTCTVTGGEAGIEILWRAAYNPVIAEAGVTLDASGAGTFSFVVPAAAVGEELTVELVGWAAPVSMGVSGGPVPTSVPSGGGPVPVWPLGLLVLAGGLALRRGVCAQA